MYGLTGLSIFHMRNILFFLLLDVCLVKVHGAENNFNRQSSEDLNHMMHTLHDFEKNNGNNEAMDDELLKSNKAFEKAANDFLENFQPKTPNSSSIDTKVNLDALNWHRRNLHVQYKNKKASNLREQTVKISELDNNSEKVRSSWPNANDEQGGGAAGLPGAATLVGKYDSIGAVPQGPRFSRNTLVLERGKNESAKTDDFRKTFQNINDPELTEDINTTSKTKIKTANCLGGGSSVSYGYMFEPDMTKISLQTPIDSSLFTNIVTYLKQANYATPINNNLNTAFSNLYSEGLNNPPVNYSLYSSQVKSLFEEGVYRYWQQFSPLSDGTTLKRETSINHIEDIETDMFRIEENAEVVKILFYYVEDYEGLYAECVIYRTPYDNGENEPIIDLMDDPTLFMPRNLSSLAANLGDTVGEYMGYFKNLVFGEEKTTNINNHNNNESIRSDFGVEWPGKRPLHRYKKVCIDTSNPPIGRIILAAGSIHSPALLLRSGVGPRDILEPLNIPVIVDIPIGVDASDGQLNSITVFKKPDYKLTPALLWPLATEFFKKTDLTECGDNISLCSRITIRGLVGANGLNLKENNNNTTSKSLVDSILTIIGETNTSSTALTYDIKKSLLENFLSSYNECKLPSIHDTEDSFDPTQAAQKLLEKSNNCESILNKLKKCTDNSITFQLITSDNPAQGRLLLDNDTNPYLDIGYLINQSQIDEAVRNVKKLRQFLQTPQIESAFSSVQQVEEQQCSVLFESIDAAFNMVSQRSLNKNEDGRLIDPLTQAEYEAHLTEDGEVINNIFESDQTLFTSTLKRLTEKNKEMTGFSRDDSKVFTFPTIIGKTDSELEHIVKATVTSANNVVNTIPLGILVGPRCHLLPYLGIRNIDVIDSSILPVSMIEMGTVFSAQVLGIYCAVLLYRKQLT